MTALPNFELSLFFLQSDSREGSSREYSENRSGNRWISRQENWKIVWIWFRIRLRHFKKLIITLLCKLGSKISIRAEWSELYLFTFLWHFVTFIGRVTTLRSVPGNFDKWTETVFFAEIKRLANFGCHLSGMYLNEKYNSFLCCNMRRAVPV